MRRQDLDFQINQMVENAISREISTGQNHLLVQKVMDNIYAIQNKKNYMTIERKLTTLVNLINGFSIAASILLGYIMGHIYVTSTTTQIIRVSFENLNLSALGIGMM